MKKGIDRVVEVIEECYERADIELQLIPYWMSYRQKYFDLVTREQLKEAQESANVFATTLGINGAVTSALINEPMSFNRVRELLDKYPPTIIVKVLEDFEYHLEKHKNSFL